MKRIIWISKSGDLCYDSSGKLYTVTDVMGIKDINVTVVQRMGKASISQRLCHRKWLMESNCMKQ